MSVQDLISEEDEARAHEYTFCLWPKSWQEYSGNPGLTLNWPEPVEIKLCEEANSPGNSSAKISL